MSIMVFFSTCLLANTKQKASLAHFFFFYRSVRIYLKKWLEWVQCGLQRARLCVLTRCAAKYFKRFANKVMRARLTVCFTTHNKSDKKGEIFCMWSVQAWFLTVKTKKNTHTQMKQYGGMCENFRPGRWILFQEARQKLISPFCGIYHGFMNFLFWFCVFTLSVFAHLQCFF